MSKSNNSGASKKQKQASDKMKEMAKMEGEMQESDQEQAEEDARMLRQLLENLVGLSFDQEQVTNEMASLNPKHRIT
ncbi:MAG: hypothetical protein IPI96_14865 [Saprospiraceae bacterium]|nr:hypothetical protein [Saprospiraceae bacterium]